MTLSIRSPAAWFDAKRRQRVNEFDIFHFHIDQFHFPLFRAFAGRTVNTLHGRQDLPDLLPLYVGFDDMPLISISEVQRLPVPNANFAATIYHGLPLALHRPVERPQENYVAFLGRISPEKRPDRAILIARALGIPLKIAAKVDRADEIYFRTQIEPMLAGPGVEFIGEINEEQKTRFSGRGADTAIPYRLAGAFLHEMRGGEMAGLHEVPFGLYYGSVDATPLFVMLLGLYVEHTGDIETLRALWPNTRYDKLAQNFLAGVQRGGLTTKIHYITNTSGYDSRKGQEFFQPDTKGHVKHQSSRPFDNVLRIDLAPRMCHLAQETTVARPMFQDRRLRGLKLMWVVASA